MISLPKLLTLLICSCIMSVSFAQQVTGKILNNEGQPIAGASVRVDNTSRGTTSNSDGSFSINAAKGETLEISVVGFQTQKVLINSSSVNIVMLMGNNNLGDIVVLGSRRAGRAKLETAVPVDVVNIPQAALPTARMDLTSILNYAAPSFNYNKQSGSDGADHIELATLRGLGPDQTLVLINGKRRHQTAFVSVFGTRGRGNSGTDLNAIPVSSIDRVEILRDGAAAQYGSDAIAGVMNIILKKSIGFSANAGASSYYDKKYNTSFSDMGQYPSHGKFDGTNFSFNSNFGFRLGEKGGFFNMSADVLGAGKTFRQVLDTNVNHTNGLPVNPYRRANGDGSLRTIGTMFNMEVPLSGGITLYNFGGYNHKSSSAYAFTRDFSARPDRFPTDANGNLIYFPDIMHTTPDGTIYYNPLIETKVQDASWATGLRGTTKKGWNWDLSNTAGWNKFHFYGEGTFNASANQNIRQTSFDDGGFSFFQNTTNLAYDKEIKGIAEGFHLALGAEYRAERYKIFAGETSSYQNYDTLKATGSQGFPGYQPSDVVNATRTAVSLFADAEMDVTKQFLLGGAIRMENYSDFGFTSNYKLSGRYKATPKLNIRGSVSTGFRAPSLQQINFSSTFTTVQGSTVTEVKIAPNYSPITKAAGIQDLKQEKSINASLGFTYKPVQELSFTIDGYYVKVKDRIVLSGQFDATDTTLNSELTSALKNLKVGLAQFFANAVNTSNMGVDIVMEYNKALDTKSRIKGILTANFQKMKIDQINAPAKLNDTKEHRQAFLSEREQAFILASAPNMKMAANLEYTYKKYTVGTRLTYFGKVKVLGYGENGLGIDPQVPTDADGSVYVKDEYNYTGKLVTDLYFTYKPCRKFGVHVGVDNIFNVHPDLGYAKSAKAWAYNGESAGPWDAVQMGTNGMRLFARLSFSF